MKPDITRIRAWLLSLVILLSAFGHAMAQNTTIADFLQRHPPDADGYIRLDGDMLISAYALTNGRQPKAVMATSFLECGCGFWGGGDVPYEWDGNVTAENRQRMLDAMQVWESVATVRFRPKNGGDLIFTHIESSATVNESTVGKIDVPLLNKIKIVNWETKFIIVHELGHCLGFWHEQSRSDRDAYIRINTTNILDGAGSNFDRHDSSDHYGPYDFDSLMHYGRCAFSRCSGAQCDTNAACQTITVLPPYHTEWQNKIGQRAHLSTMDALTMSFLYPQPNWMFVDNSKPSDNAGTFLKPYLEFPVGAARTPNNGTLWVQPGTYSAVGLYPRPMTIRAPLAPVTLH